MKEYSVVLVFFLILCTVIALCSLPKGVVKNTESVEDSGSSEDVLRVSYLDVGQGDATFITFPNGQQMLVDCAVDGRILEALGREMDFYDKFIDYLVITHPDKDHYGGCIDVLRRFDVGHIVHSGVGKKSDFFDVFERVVESEQAMYHKLVGEHVWHIASTTIHFLYPDRDLVKDYRVPGSKKDTGFNNTSLVFRLSYAGISFLFTGDGEIELEQYILEKYGAFLDVDILKAGHHGGADSSSSKFLDVVSPLHTIFSAGKGNHYGHPSPRIIRRVERLGSAIWRTDRQGDILVYILSPEKYYVTSTRMVSF